MKIKTIEKASLLLKDKVHHTQVMTNNFINRLVGGEIYFKCENFQKTGSFKIRGASNAVFNLTDEQVSRGVITHSSGNHGAALAQAAAWRGCKCYVVTPNMSPEIKKKALRNYGAEITFSEVTLTSRIAETEKIIEKTGAAFIHPYDNDNVIAGAGTAALELIREIPDLDCILAPVGGGGGMSGTAIVAKESNPSIKTYGAEPALADDAWRSFTSGVLHGQLPAKTIADGLRTALSERTFAYIRQYVDDILRVNDEQIVAATRMVWERMKIIIETSSATPFAAVLANKALFTGKKTGIIITGGNVDLDHLPWDEQN